MRKAEQGNKVHGVLPCVNEGWKRGEEDEKIWSTFW